MDLYAKAVNLLEQVATSVHERDLKNPNPLCFSVSEVQVVELWLKSFMKELEKPESGDTNRLFCIQTNNKEVSYEK